MPSRLWLFLLASLASSYCVGTSAHAFSSTPSDELISAVVTKQVKREELFSIPRYLTLESQAIRARENFGPSCDQFFDDLLNYLAEVARDRRNNSEEEKTTEQESTFEKSTLFHFFSPQKRVVNDLYAKLKVSWQQCRQPTQTLKNLEQQISMSFQAFRAHEEIDHTSPFAIKVAALEMATLMGRILQAGLHTKIPELDRYPQCLGGIFSDLYLHYFLLNQVDRKFGEAAKNLKRIQDQLGCLRSDQSYWLALALPLAYDLVTDRWQSHLLADKLAELYFSVAILLFDTVKHQPQRSALLWQWLAKHLNDFLFDSASLLKLGNRYARFYLYDREVGHLKQILVPTQTWKRPSVSLTFSTPPRPATEQASSSLLKYIDRSSRAPTCERTPYGICLEEAYSTICERGFTDWQHIVYDGKIRYDWWEMEALQALFKPDRLGYGLDSFFDMLYRHRSTSPKGVCLPPLLGGGDSGSAEMDQIHHAPKKRLDYLGCVIDKARPFSFVRCMDDAQQAAVPYAEACAIDPRADKEIPEEDGSAGTDSSDESDDEAEEDETEEDEEEKEEEEKAKEDADKKKKEEEDKARKKKKKDDPCAGNAPCKFYSFGDDVYEGKLKEKKEKGGSSSGGGKNGKEKGSKLREIHREPLSNRREPTQKPQKEEKPKPAKSKEQKEQLKGNLRDVQKALRLIKKFRKTGLPLREGNTLIKNLNEKLKKLITDKTIRAIVKEAKRKVKKRLSDEELLEILREHFPASEEDLKEALEAAKKAAEKAFDKPGGWLFYKTGEEGKIPEQNVVAGWAYLEDDELGIDLAIGLMAFYAWFDVGQDYERFKKALLERLIKTAVHEALAHGIGLILSLSDKTFEDDPLGLTDHALYPALVIALKSKLGWDGINFDLHSMESDLDSLLENLEAEGGRDAIEESSDSSEEGSARSGPSERECILSAECGCPAITQQFLAKSACLTPGGIELIDTGRIGGGVIDPSPLDETSSTPLPTCDYGGEGEGQNECFDKDCGPGYRAVKDASGQCHCQKKSGPFDPAAVKGPGKNPCDIDGCPDSGETPATPPLPSPDPRHLIQFPRPSSSAIPSR